MKITNKAGLPQALVNAVTNDPYKSGDCDITVTQLVGPAQVRVLRKQYDELITEDAAERIWSLFGQSIHTILERSGQLSPDTIEEWRLFTKYGDHVLSGQIDLLDIDASTMWDFKTTSIWAIKDGPKSEWVAQLNVLHWLVERNGGKGDVKRLCVCTILRDWTRTMCKKSPDWIPDVPVKVIEVPMWAPYVTEAYVKERLAEHFGECVPECSAIDRWAKSDTWAVMKPKRQSALRVYESIGLAEHHVAQEAGLYIEFRPGESTRCEHYCSVADFCPQFAALKKKGDVA